MFDYLLNILNKSYYFLFDRFIIYPMLRFLHNQYNLRFMNLGYQSLEDEELPNLKKLCAEDLCCKANIALYEKALSLCPKYPNFDGLRLLEVGCGQGGGIEWILRAHQSFVAVNGIEPIIVDSKCGRIVQGRAEQLPFDNDSFDIVLSVESSHLYANCRQFFQECSRVLCEDGFLCWTDLRYTHQLSTTLHEARESGLQLNRMEDITLQVLRGIQLTSARYESMLQHAPYFVRLFQESIRTTYCAPGTLSYQRFLTHKKIYVCACWQNQNSKHKNSSTTM
ncbi:unnamed protein product [Thelazia callipaeda]|uniref:Methyltransf_11 domain-containing protein n=1 Tax=Thelazia callipaeda TaxID=103827 RepID=A0A0N5D181_THECL|nr:unnamed protein product [Thelazia callipaeda]